MTARLYRSVGYDTKVWTLLISLLVGLSFTTFALKQSFFAKNIIVVAENNKPFYLFEPPYLKSAFDSLEIDYEEYQKNVAMFLESNQLMGLEVITTSTLADVDTKSVLILLDIIALSKEDKKEIDLYVKNGGALLFNSSVGFRDEHGKFKGDQFLHGITDLSLSTEYGYLRFEEGLMATPRLLSPIASLPNGPLLEIVLYDPLPLFSMPATHSADLYMTNHSQASYPTVDSATIPRESSGLIWSGTYGKGKWAYSSLPLYTFYESQQSSKNLLKLYRGMVEYLDFDIVARAYPYLDAKSVSFVSEDTEYRFESVGQFSKLSQRYKIPTTIFCVAALAQENRALMDEVIKNPYLEVGSHSYTHKAIVGTSKENYLHESKGSKELLESLTKKKVQGFRPPREEIDAQLLADLEASQFTYILGANETVLYPHFKNRIMMIPRHGTDDYSYLVNLDWTPKEIANSMIKESKFYQELNGIYAMSTHTHLMNFSTNISILEQYYQYIQNNVQMRSMNGEMLYNRITALQKISLKVTSDINNITVKVTNQNETEIKDYTFRLYSTHKPITTITAQDKETKLLLIKVEDGVYDVRITLMKPSTQLILTAK